jgi:transcriptional regulator with XRE-family HTH domain
MTLKEARFKKNKQQWWITKETGISQSTLSLFESGLKRPSELQKAKIAQALGFKLMDIVYE